MIRTPSGKNLMNEQEAIQWLLDNNALPFQCTADYVGGAEIGLGTIVNPSPAKVRVGSLIFFADSKVSTVIAITSNSFICSDEYNDLVDDIVYVSNVQLNASGHLIVTLSNGTDIDAGLIKQITGFNINASQHLIASYNDGTSADLGAIFSGNITVSGNLTVTGGITGASIIEDMAGYSYIAPPATAGITVDVVFAGAVKNGNKVTFVLAMELTRTDTISATNLSIGTFVIPTAVGSKLYPSTIGSGDYLDVKKVTAYKQAWSGYDITCYTGKSSNGAIYMIALTQGMNDNFTLNTKHYARYEVTFLLSDPLNS